MNRKMNSKFCPCGSGNSFSKCCEPYVSILDIKINGLDSETSLLSWLDKYSIPIVQSFRSKVDTYLFRISWYLDGIIDQYLYPEYPGTSSNQLAANKAFFHIKHNILLSLFASLSCLSQGLFLQSGTLLRSLIEDCLVLIDLSENEGQIEKFLQAKYSTNGLVSRVKKSIPNDVARWYGYFSANFTHVGPLHPAPYLPRACYPDNYILVVGLQNIVRGIVTFHIVLERLYFDQITNPFFWKLAQDKSVLVFNEDNRVSIWVEQLGKEIVDRHPPNERKEGFFYDTQGYRPK